MASSYPISRTETYSDESSFNTVDIYIPRDPESQQAENIWIVFVHGGGWRDPEILASSFNITRDKLLYSSIAPHVAGYASIDYRLSPSPAHPKDPSNPSDPARNAKHPDHINDVLTAILYLQEKYHFEDRYLLVGHSVGATLAMQVAMKRYWGSQYESTYALELNVTPPIAILGLQGVYDIAALVANHDGVPIYRDFVTNALGPSGWDAASPVNADFEDTWPDGKFVVLARSSEDFLVEEDQLSRMKNALAAQGWTEKGDKKIKTFELKGEHDEVWETGDIARAIEFAVQEFLR
jgi:kynurenine formamidase